MGKKKPAVAVASAVQTAPASPGPGRPPTEIDVTLLEALAERCLTQEDCAAILKVSVDTIQRRYLDVYKAGLQKGKGSLRRKQFEMAMAGNVTMLVWLGKNMLGQADRHELTGKDGAPLVPDYDREEIIGKLIGSGPTPPAKRVQ